MAFHEHNCKGLIYDTADGFSSVGGIYHAFTTRHGGVSPAPFDTLNFADNRGDTSENLLENYRRLGAAVGFNPSRVVGCRQIHSSLVHVADEADAGKILWDERPCDADALITNIPELPLVVFGSDCNVVLLYDPVTRCIGAAHAGWRGTAGGIVQKTSEAMMKTYGAQPQNIHAALGPSIGKCCFETDADVPAALHALHIPEIDAQIERRGQKYHIDLKGINRCWLLRSGIFPEHIEVHPDCTMCRTDRYWSHRKMGDARGGMIAVIALKEDA